MSHTHIKVQTWMGGEVDKTGDGGVWRRTGGISGGEKEGRREGRSAGGRQANEMGFTDEG